ncbi:hypothetical protein GQ54DRAFT_2476 [Martensiomyces pterosporus]|nr:hypothetical protein GQ54DRAFT_2476 [Martensiomyces pterosporus]
MEEQRSEISQRHAVQTRSLEWLDRALAFPKSLFLTGCSRTPPGRALQLPLVEKLFEPTQSTPCSTHPSPDFRQAGRRRLFAAACCAAWRELWALIPSTAKGWLFGWTALPFAAWSAFLRGQGFLGRGLWGFIRPSVFLAHFTPKTSAFSYSPSLPPGCLKKE